MTKRPLTVIVTSVFVLLNSLIWLALGILIATGLHPGMSVPAGTRSIMAFLSFAIVAVLLGLFIFLNKGSRTAYYLILAFFTFTAVLTFFDDVGWSDLLVLLINIIPLILLIKDRAYYLPALNPAQ